MSLLQLSSPESQTADSISCRVETGLARTAEERLAAARLVGSRYRQEGYLSGVGEDTLFLSTHHNLPQTSVFVTREKDRVIGTLTVVCDSTSGLPMEELYGEEIDALRTQRRKLCELCSLAVDPEAARRSPETVIGLFRCAMAYLLHVTPTTDALITLKPEHERFYRRRMFFEPLGRPMLDSRFNDAPTVAMRLTRETVLDTALLHELD